MTNRFFDQLDDQEKEKIAKARDQLVTLLNEWTQQYPCIRPSRIPMAAFSTALIFGPIDPPISPNDFLTLPKFGLWTFAVDDVTDERIMPLSEAVLKVEEWCQIARHGYNDSSIDESDQLSRLILEVTKDLGRFPLFEALLEQWICGFEILLSGILEEYRYGINFSAKGNIALPSLEEYLAHSLGSIGVIVWSYVAFIILGDPETVTNQDPINQALYHSSVAIRLYNDLQSYDREVQEGNVNSIVITHNALASNSNNSDQQNILAEAKQHVRSLADTHAKQCFEIVSSIQTQRGNIEKILQRTLAFHADFYTQLDYHTTSLTKTDEMLSTRSSG